MIKPLFVPPSGFSVHFLLLFYIDFILVVMHHDDGHRSGRNMLLVEHVYKCALVGLSY